MSVVLPPEIDESPFAEFVQEKKRITLTFQQEHDVETSITDGAEIQLKLILWREAQPLNLKTVKLEKIEEQSFLFLVESETSSYPLLIRPYKRSERNLVPLQPKDFSHSERNFEITDFSVTSNVFKFNIITRGCFTTIMKSPLYFVAIAIGSTENCGAKIAISRHYSVYEKYDDDENENPLLRAVFNGEYQKINELLQINTVDTIDRNGASALQIACLYGYEECVKELIKFKSKIDLQDKDGRSALHKAAYSGQAGCLSLLISNNANINLRDMNGATPLHIAGYKNRLECATILLDHGALINIQDKHGITPLHQVSHQGHSSLCKLILSRGGDPNIPGKDGIRALESAFHNGSADCAQLLLNGGANMKKDENLVHLCAFNGSNDCLKLLISLGLNASSKDEELSTPLHKAAFNGHLECLKVLIKASAEINVKDEEDSTPLHKACYSGHVDCVSFLIENGAGVDAEDCEGGTPLHNACCNGHHEVAVILLANNANPNLSDSQGSTPLHLACENGFIQCISLLLIYKISVDIKDAREMTPLHYSVDHPKVVELLIEKGANINAQDINGNTPLFRAISHNIEESVRILLAKGADVNIKNNANKTVLDICDGYLKKVIEEESSGSIGDLEKAKKMKIYEEAAIKFNEKPKTGIEFLLTSQSIGEDNIVDEIVQFFHRYGSHLHKAKLGEVLGENDPRSLEILTRFVNYMDFTGFSFDAALRSFLSKFRLPGEAQKIDRIMEKFARRYHENNTNIFPNEDFAYLLAFSLIMLNTDLHNPSIKHKMTKEQFVKNNSNTGLEGGDLSDEFLIKMYENIEENEIKMDNEDAVFGKSLIAKSGWLIKQGGRIKTWKKRWFILSDKVLYYFKEKQEEMSKACGIVPLEDVIVRNAESKKKFCFELYTPTENTSIKAMKRTQGQIQKGHHESYFISAKSTSEMEEWMEAISDNIFSNPYKKLIAGKLELKKNRLVDNDQRLVHFNELFDYAHLCSIAYLGKEFILQQFNSAIVEPPVKEISHFYYNNVNLRCQFIVVVGKKWDSSVTLMEDLYKRNNIVDYYSLPQNAKFIAKMYKKNLKKEIPIVLVGHSIGGSIVLLMANILEKSGFVIANITTFGQLKVLTEKQLNSFSSYSVRRVCHYKDPLINLFQNYHHTAGKILLLKGVHYCLFDDAEQQDGQSSITESKLAFNSIDIYKQSIQEKLGHSVRVDPQKRNLYY